MNKPQSIYHNELLGAIAITVVVKQVELTYAKSLFVLPFLFHNETVNVFIEYSPNNFKTFVSNNSKLVANFNNRFYSLLPISINSILIARELQWINYEKGLIYFKDFDFSQDYGIRAKKIINISHKIADILKTDLTELFYHLKVEL